MNSIYLLLLSILLIVWWWSAAVDRQFFGPRAYRQMPYTWFVLGWLPGTVLLVFPIYQYPEELTLSDVAYVASAHLAFAIAGMLVCMVKGRSEVGSPRPSIVGRRMTTGLLLSGLAAQVLRTVDAVESGDLNFLERISISGLSRVKREYVDAAVVSKLLGEWAIAVQYLSAIGQVGLVAYSCALATGMPWARGRRLATLAILVGVAMVFNSWFLTGGRLGIVLTALFAAVPWLLRPAAASAWRGRRASARNVRSFALWTVGVAAVLFLSTVFILARLGTSDPLNSLYAAHRAKLTPGVESLVNGSPVGETLLLQASYVSTTLPTLAYYLHLTDEALPGPLYGGFSLQHFYLLFGRLLPGFNPQLGYEAFIAVTSPLVDAGYYGNVWSTMLRESIIDFGRFGALIYMAVLGALSQALRYSYRRSPTVELGAIYTLVSIQLLFSGFHTLTSHILFGPALVFSTLFFVAGLVWKPRNRMVAAPTQQRPFIPISPR